MLQHRLIRVIKHIPASAPTPAGVLFRYTNCPILYRERHSNSALDRFQYIIYRFIPFHVTCKMQPLQLLIRVNNIYIVPQGKCIHDPLHTLVLEHEETVFPCYIGLYIHRSHVNGCDLLYEILPIAKASSDTPDRHSLPSTRSLPPQEPLARTPYRACSR